MKKIFIYIFTFLVLASCKKKENESIINPSSFDYRDVFVGNYQAHRLCTYWTISNPIVDTTCNQDIIISITKSPQYSNKLIVENDTIPIDSNGYFTAGMNEIAGYKFYSITLRNDSITLSTFNGGLGGGTSCNTKGKK